jgi:class 3 adenylate cyclase
MIPGKKVMAIYGFCDIRNFTDSTEILQEKVMIFVNEIAEIVHEITSDHCGSANKNIGDAFLLVWKFEDKFVEKDADGNLILKKCTEVSQMVDLALVAFLKILAKVQKSFKLDKVREYLTR